MHAELRERALQSMIDSYIETMLWSSSDDGEEHLDRNYSADDLADETVAKIALDCTRFFEMFGPTILEARDGFSRGSCCGPYAPATGPESIWAQAGHDLWLNRCGHGCGFWDGDWPEPQATILDKGAKAMGEQWPYVGNDGLIYLG